MGVYMKTRNVDATDKKELKEILYKQHIFHQSLRKDVFDKVDMDLLITDEWVDKVIESETMHFIVCEHEKKFVGMIMFSEETTDNEAYHDKKWIYINELIVNKNFRSRGIGKKLMEFVEIYAENNSIHIIKLDVWENNQKAIDFYLRNEYKKMNLGMWKKV